MFHPTSVFTRIPRPEAEDLFSSIHRRSPMRRLSPGRVAKHVILSASLALSALASPMVRADDVNAISNTGTVNIAGMFDVPFISLNINTPAPRELVISYFAECQVQSGYIEYDILVDNVEVSPTHDNFSALCSSPAAPATVGTVVYRQVGAGNHSIRVRGHVEAGFGGRIDDQSLVVVEHGP
jgi:hypothetical protein